MSSDEETAKLFRIWKTTLEMLRDRGFIVLDSDIKMSLREFIDKFGENFKRENLDMFKTKKDDANDGIFVFFPNEPKLNVKITKRYAERMRTENVLRGIIVVKDAPTPVAKRAIEDLSQKYYIEVFLDAELLVNVNNHMLVPKHEVLSNEEKKELLKRYTVKETQEHEPWCKRYMELYNELRENWERLYWEEGYSKKVAEDHANYESSEDDDSDFSPYRRRRPFAELRKDHSFGGPRSSDNTWENVRQIQDKFEYDRETRMREKAFAPMNAAGNFDRLDSAPRNQPLDAGKYFPQNSRD